MSSEKGLVLPNSVSVPSPTFSHDEHAKQLEGSPAEGSSSGSEHAYEEHGPGIDHKITQDNAVQSHPTLWWSRTRHMLREPFSEFFGVFILILFGDGHVQCSEHITTHLTNHIELLPKLFLAVERRDPISQYHGVGGMPSCSFFKYHAYILCSIGVMLGVYASGVLLPTSPQAEHY